MHEGCWDFGRALPSSPLRANFAGFRTPPRHTLAGRTVASNSPARKLFNSSAASGNMSRTSIEGFVTVSPVKSAMESLSFFKVVASESMSSSPSVRSSRRVSELGTERSSCDQLSGDECPSTPRAPVKPNRIRSLKTFFPGNTRRKLDFDGL